MPAATSASHSASPVLECDALGKRFGDRVAVDGVGFSIAPGEVFGLLGPNGAGKTTTISRNVLPEGFSYSAPTQLVLFVFINALAAGAAIIETRRLGMFERMSAAPVRAGTIIAGTALTYASLTLVQSALLVLVGAIAFGVSWGNPLAAGALVVTWSLVGTGAGMLSGTVFRTAEQATAVGAVSGIGLGMLGGCMWPLSIVSSTMRVVGHLTPQAWAVDAWTGLVARGGNLASIAGQLAILAAFAVGFVVLASVRLRRELL